MATGSMGTDWYLVFTLNTTASLPPDFLLAEGLFSVYHFSTGLDVDMSAAGISTDPVTIRIYPSDNVEVFTVTSLSISELIKGTQCRT